MAQITVPIPAGATGLSAAVNLFNQTITAIIIPAGWLAADITFKGGSLATNVQNVYDNTEAEVTLQAAASRAVGVPTTISGILAGMNWIVFRSGTAGTPVNQTGAPSLIIITKPTP